MQINGRNILLALSLAIAGAILWYFREIVSYVLIAWVLSMLGQPLMHFLQARLRFRNHIAGTSLCAALTLVIFIAFFGILFAIFVPLIIEQANNLSQVNYAAIYKTLEQPIAQLSAFGQKFGLLKPGVSAMQEAQNDLAKYIDPSLVSGIVATVISTAGGILIGFVSVLFISFFFLQQEDMLTNFLTSFVSPDRDSSIRQAVEETSTLLSRYFSGIFLQILLIGLFLTIALSIAGIKNAVLIAAFAALINVIPYLGPSLGGLFACFITISSNIALDFYSGIVPLLIRVAIVFASMQFVNDWFMGPLIFSNRVRAHPLEIFLVTLAGAHIGGIAGMLLAIPGYTVLRVIARAFFNHLRFVQKMTDSLAQNANPQ